MKMLGNSIYFFFYSHRSHRYVNRFSLFPLSFPHFVPSANEKKKKKSEPTIISTVEMLLFTSLVDKLLCLCEYTIYALLLTYAQKPINGNKQMRRRQRRKSWMNTWANVCMGAKYFRIKDKSVRLNWNSAVWLLELQRISHSIKSFCMQSTESFIPIHCFPFASNYKWMFIVYWIYCMCAMPVTIHVKHIRI